MRINTPARRVTALGGAAALLVGGLVAISAPAEAAALTYTAAPNTGSSTATTVVTVTGKDFKTAANVSRVLAGAGTGVTIATSCGTSSTTLSGEDTTGGVTGFSVVSATKMLVTIATPDLNADGSKKDFKVCVYAATGNALLGSAVFSAYPTPTVTGVDGDTADGGVGTDASGPAFGGQTIAVDGTGFTAKSTVKVGGVAATSVKFIDSTSLTAVAPAGSGTQKNVQVTTEGGPSAANTWYDYVTAITVTPAVGHATTDVITINGTGFKALFTGSGTAGVLFDQEAGGWTGQGNEIAAVADASVTVVSDTEIAFSLPAGIVSAPGAYTVYVADDITDADGAGLGYLSVITGGSTFTSAPF
jgi:hypothetical protein